MKRNMDLQGARLLVQRERRITVWFPHSVPASRLMELGTGAGLLPEPGQE